MIREIKFRAKSKNLDPTSVPKDSWCYGYFAKLLDNGEVKPYIINSECCFEVDESTLCQFTGIYDSNWKEVYEGDIVMFKKIIKGSSTVSYCYRKVIFRDGCFVFKEHGRYNSIDVYSTNGKLPGDVAGNIYDNPELLKQE